MQLVEIGRLPHHFVALHQQHVGIVARDEGRHQLVLFFVGFILQNIHGELQQLVAMSGINVGGIEQ